MDLITITTVVFSLGAVFFAGATVGYVQCRRDLSPEGKVYEIDLMKFFKEEEQPTPTSTPAKRRRGRPAKSRMPTASK